ncbi:MAG: YdcF family protein [Firmicutes bacterium]|nr:YdcF family protein [Bacillota bacterium]
MHRFKVISISIVVLVIAFLYTPLIQSLASPLVVKDPLRKADAVVILSGGWESKGHLGKSTLERYRYGIKLFQKGYGKYLVFSGGNLWGTPSEADEMAEMAMSDGFSNESIVIEGNSESTWENALFVKRALLERDLNSVVLVTSPYHSLRAKTLFKDKGIKVISAPVPNSEFYNASGLENLRIARLVLLEYIKLGLYKLNITN